MVSIAFLKQDLTQPARFEGKFVCFFYMYPLCYRQNYMAGRPHSNSSAHLSHVWRRVFVVWLASRGCCSDMAEDAEDPGQHQQDQG